MSYFKAKCLFFPRSLVSAPFFTPGYWLDSPSHSVLHTSRLTGQGLNASSSTPQLHQLIPVAPVHPFSYFSILSPKKLSCALSIYIMSCLSTSSPHFSLSQEENARQSLFQFKRWAFLFRLGWFVGFFLK